MSWGLPSALLCSALLYSASNAQLTSIHRSWPLTLHFIRGEQKSTEIAAEQSTEEKEDGTGAEEETDAKEGAEAAEAEGEVETEAEAANESVEEL